MVLERVEKRLQRAELSRGRNEQVRLRAPRELRSSGRLPSFYTFAHILLSSARGGASATPFLPGGAVLRPPSRDRSQLWAPEGGALQAPLWRRRPSLAADRTRWPTFWSANAGAVQEATIAAGVSRQRRLVLRDGNWVVPVLLAACMNTRPVMASRTGQASDSVRANAQGSTKRSCKKEKHMVGIKAAEPRRRAAIQRRAGLVWLVAWPYHRVRD